VRGAAFLIVLLISGCGTLHIGDNIQVQPANSTAPISQGDIATVKQVFDEVAKEFSLAAASAADIKAEAEWCARLDFIAAEMKSFGVWLNY
jgi:hypothetical protein